MIYNHKKGQDDRPFEVPSDWTVHISYNVGTFDGEVKIESWVDVF